MKILIIGFGVIGQALLHPLIHDLGIQADKISIIAKEGDSSIAHRFGCRLEYVEIDATNLEEVLKGRLDSGDWLLNLSVEVSSLALLDWCQARDVFYLDTCIEPWKDGYAISSGAVDTTTNYFLRHQALLRAKPGARTTVVAHGANPGIVTHLTKEILGLLCPMYDSWALKAQALRVRSIHISELDTQHSVKPVPAGTFMNTWSPAGFVSELHQKVELGLGSHEDQNHMYPFSYGRRCAAWMDTPGRLTDVETWVPSMGFQTAKLVTHHESISLASLLTVSVDQRVFYRPTVHYSYIPCPAARKGIDSWNEENRAFSAMEVLRDDIISGFDELGVLLDCDGTLFWHGSRVSINEARRVAPFNNATSLQVVGGIIGAMRWAQRNPFRGVVEAEDMDHEEVLRDARPYLGEMLTIGLIESRPSFGIISTISSANKKVSNL